MASKNMAFFQVLISSIFLLVFPRCSCEAYDDVAKLKQCSFNAIYNFGASLSDTGNQIIEIPQVWSTKLPYGQAIHKVTGRSSDGLLIIDYIGKQTFFFLIFLL
jgi:zeta-carotene desaturase